MAEDNSGLLIAALVAIVAVVGLVILFSGARTGMYVVDNPQSTLGPATVGQTGLCACPAGYAPTMQGRSGNLASCTCRMMM